ncbi:MAG: hypothetical protein HXY24_16485, partial [Rubrivivax sp.]|nr:hypothetical protein [Rubrivivax sp.]
MKKAITAIGIVGILLATLYIAKGYAQGPSPSSPSSVLQGEITGSGDTINFQGQLYDNGGNPVAPGNYNMEFSICTDAGCGGIAWGPNEVTAVVDDQGLFSVLLAGLNASHFTGDRWLRVRVCTAANQNPCASGWDDLRLPDYTYPPMTSGAISIGNIRKNVVDESRASSNLSILTVINEANGRGI